MMSQKSQSFKALMGPLALFLVLVAAYCFDSFRVRLEEKDPSLLPPVSTGLPALTKRVVFVVLDSIPIRVSSDLQVMPELNAIGARGASGVMIATRETTTTAGIRAMSVGTKPGFKDTLDMFTRRPFTGWAIFDELVSRGEGVSFYGDHSWRDLLGDRDLVAVRSHQKPGGGSLFENDAEAWREARARLNSDELPTFLSLHLASTDFAAHQFGTESEQYKNKIREVDAELGRFFREVFRPGMTFIVTSDHGCDRYGSHGGDGDVYRRVPLVMIGDGIAPVRDFELENRQMPLILAALLGTRLPAGIVEDLNPLILSTGAGQKRTLVEANLRRLESLGRFVGADRLPVVPNSSPSSDELSRLQTQERQWLDAINQSSRLDPGALLWVGILLLAVIFLFSCSFRPYYVAPVWWAGVGLSLGALFLTSHLRLVSLSFLLGLMIWACIVAATQLATLRAKVVAGGLFLISALIVSISAVRFAGGASMLISLFKRAAVPGVTSAVCLGLLAWKPSRLRAKIVEQWANRSFSENGIMAIIVLVFCTLRPIESVPILIVASLLLGLRSLGVPLRWTWGSMLFLLGFFLATERIAFGWAGERVWLRYLYTSVSGIGLIGILVRGLGLRRGRLIEMVMALICLLPLWAFGYVTLGLAVISKEVSQVSLGLDAAIILILVWRVGVVRWCLAPLLAVGIYHLMPAPVSFCVAAAILFGILGVLTGYVQNSREKHFAIIGVMGIFLFLLSTGVDFLSVLLVCLSLYFIIKSSTENEQSSLQQPLLVALVAVGVRYEVLNIFGHSGGPPYHLNNLDTHSGFALMLSEVPLWVPTLIVTWKMVCASVLVFALVFSSERIRKIEFGVTQLIFAICGSYFVESAIEMAFSYGPKEVLASNSAVQMVFHGGMIFLVFFGYLGYKLLIRNSSSLSSRGLT